MGTWPASSSGSLDINKNMCIKQRSLSCSLCLQERRLCKLPCFNGVQPHLQSSAQTLMAIVRSSACTGESELVLGFYVLHHYEDGFVVM